MSFLLSRQSRRRGALAAVAAGTLAVLAASSIAGAPPARAATVYVISPSGSDTAAGTSAAPFKTIQKCATVAVAGDVCEIQSGTYRETVRPTNSGTAAAPITFREAPGATVTIDGTNAVSGWTVDSGNIYKATVTLAGTAAEPYSSTPLPSNTQLWANQVFSNGAEILEASFPSMNTDRMAQVARMTFSATPDPATGCGATRPCPIVNGTVTNPSFPAAGDMTGATAIFEGSWTSMSATVTGGNLNGTNKTLNITYPANDAFIRPANQRRMYLIGKKAFLTGANQFYYDPAATTLFVRTAGGAPSGITAKARNYAFDLNDRDFIKIEQVSTFASTIRTNGGSNGNVIDGIEARFLSHFQTTQYDRGLSLAGVYASHRYDTGILLHGTNNSLLNSKLTGSAGAGVNVEGSGHVVRNNFISDVDYRAGYGAAVNVEDGTSNSAVVFNTVRRTGRDGMALNSKTDPIGQENNRIGYNDIADFGRLTFDLGAIYVCCRSSQAGSRYDHNVMHDPAANSSPRGLYFDNGTYAESADHNITWNNMPGITIGGRTSVAEDVRAGIPFNQGWFANNSFRSGSAGPFGFHHTPAEDVRMSELTNNIMDGEKPASQPFEFEAGGVPTITTNIFTRKSFNNTGTDPLFATNGPNLTLQSGSPAIDAGTVIPGITDGYAGSAPDLGAFESGAARWLAGCSFAGCGEAGSATYSVLLSGLTGKVVRDDTTIVQATLGTLSSHQWQVARGADRLYTFTNRSTSECLASPSATSGAAAVTNACSGSTANQKWRLVEAGNGQVQIVSNSTGLCLGVANGAAADGTAILTNTCANVNGQKFLLPKVA